MRFDAWWYRSSQQRDWQSSFQPFPLKVRRDLMIHQLVYYSRNTVPGDGRAMLTNMREILSASQRNNSRDGITGFLIFDKTWFVQILEGERAMVTGTYNRIARDPRHTAAAIINVSDVEARLFPNWTMGGAMRTPEVQEIYLQHGFGGPLEPSRLKSKQIVDLALDLQAFEVAKRQNARLAS
ncbi:BLUF domain-containing protein [Methylobacterium sp. NEAU K]|uniref:BLUF domain-containing protein n=1 Tax=Methylobacterium sp. NEAU K TaxID=3064946 RepID=UPI002736C44C|nr:BLUF domain-containing protein [Methylobacterium sp. NEAU K]MDP4003203.1 BLUF domain-containing protein [Methylobacterium sp. NEAU K]